MKVEWLQNSESTGSRRNRGTKRFDEWNIEWSRYPERVERE